MGDAAVDEGKLPRQVIGVLDTGVHALGPCGTMHMCSVAGQEDTPVAVARNTAPVHAIAGHPVLLDNLGWEGHSFVEHRLELFVGRLAVVGAGSLGTGRYVAEDAKPVLAGHRES